MVNPFLKNFLIIQLQEGLHIRSELEISLFKYSNNGFSFLFWLLKFLKYFKIKKILIQVNKVKYWDQMVILFYKILKSEGCYLKTKAFPLGPPLNHFHQTYQKILVI